MLVKELGECICMGRIAGEEGEQSQLIDATSCVKMYNAGKLGYISSHQIKKLGAYCAHRGKAVNTNRMRGNNVLEHINHILY